MTIEVLPLDPSEQRLISNSEVRTFKRCRRKWWFSHYLQLKPKYEGITGPRAFGTAMHAVLAEYYDPTNTDVVDAETALASWDVDQQFNFELAEDADVVEAFTKEWGLGRIMLEGYFEWLESEGPDSTLEVLDAETEVFYDLTIADQAIRLSGKYDLRVIDKVTGFRSFVDHKNVANVTDLAKIAELDEQFKWYAMLDILTNGEESFTDGGVFNMLRKVKRTSTATPPFYKRVEVRFNRDILRNFWKRVHGEVTDIVNVTRSIDAGADPHMVAYPNPTKDCSWDCDFRKLCPMADDPLSDFDLMVEVEYEQGDPYARYETKDSE